MAKAKTSNLTKSQAPSVNAAWIKLLNHLLSQLRAGHFKNVPGSDLTEEDLTAIIAQFEAE